MPDSKGIEPVVVQTFRMEVAGGLAAAALIPSRLCSAADETAKVREIVPAITAADQVAAARKTHLWRDRANCAVVQVPRRTNASLCQGAGSGRGSWAGAKAGEWLVRRAGCWGVIRPRWL